MKRRILDHQSEQEALTTCQKCIALASNPNPENVEEEEEWSFQVSRCPVVKKIPKASRNQAIDGLWGKIDNALREGSQESWSQLGSFARSFFGRPKRGGKKHKSLATIINKRFRDDENGVLTVEEFPDVSEKRMKDSSDEKVMQKHVNSKMAAIDVKGAEIIEE